MTTGASPALKALKYAENELGVHEVYTDAMAARDRLDSCLTDLSEARDAKREVEAQMQDIEMEIISDERSKHPDMSQAQMDKHVKLAIYQHDGHSAHRAKHVQIINDIEGLDMDKAMAEVDIRIAVARLQELGGYFQYLAAIKQAGSTNTPTSETSTS